MIAVRGQEGRLRLLDTTLAFASRRLAKTDEENHCRRRHALYFCDLFKQGASTDEHERPKAFGDEVDNLRTALNWAFSVEGEAKIGVELAAASASTWMAMALLTECREWMTKAISRLDEASAGSREEMIIQSALASCMMFTEGMTEEFVRKLGESASSCRVPQRHRMPARFPACSLGSPDTASNLCRCDRVG